MSLESFPRYPLMFGPSPIHRLYRLTEYLEGATVWPSETTSTPHSPSGGNKTRKLEVPRRRTPWRAAVTRSCRSVACNRNHTRQVAAAAAKTGMKCVLIQESWVDWPDVTYDRVGNILLSRLMAPTSVSWRAGFGIGFKESWSGDSRH